MKYLIILVIGLLLISGCVQEGTVSNDDSEGPFDTNEFDDAAGGPTNMCGDGECQDWELTESHAYYCPQDC